VDDATSLLFHLPGGQRATRPTPTPQLLRVSVAWRWRH